MGIAQHRTFLLAMKRWNVTLQQIDVTFFVQTTTVEMGVNIIVDKCAPAKFVPMFVTCDNLV